MPLYRPSELKEFLITHGLSPKKVLSQNFLIDGNIVRKIAALAEPKEGDLILEVGPGPGVLTEQLLETGATVAAVEKDSQLSGLLPRIPHENGRLYVYNEDIMEFPLEERLAPLLRGGAKAKVVANLPYHLTTPILQKLVPMGDLFSKIVVMVQDEVARRFTGRPGTSDYGAFTVFLDFYSKSSYAFQVKRNCFYPPPKVDSAVIALDITPPPVAVEDHEGFFELTRSSFQMRRKVLRNSLAKLYSKDSVDEALEKLGLDTRCRAEELSLDQYVSLYSLLKGTKR